MLSTLKQTFIIVFITFLLSACQKQYYIIKEANYYGIGSQDSTPIKPIYDDIVIHYTQQKRPFAIITYNDKMGIIDHTFTIVLQPLYDDIEPFFNGFSKITLNNKVGLINETFDVVLKPKYESIEGFYNDVAFVQSKGLFGCIDKKMNLKIKPEFDKIYVEKNGYSRIVKNDKWGFVDNQCNTMIKPIYDYVYDFSSNQTAQVIYKEKHYHINEQGTLLTNHKKTNPYP